MSGGVVKKYRWNSNRKQNDNWYEWKLSDCVTLCKGVDIWFQDPDRYVGNNIWNNQETDASLWCAKVLWVDSLNYHLLLQSLIFHLSFYQ